MGQRLTGVFPTRKQELLLRAALLPGDKALSAWRDWQRQVNLDHIDLGSYRLLPLLYRNLERLEVKDSLMDRYRGIYRQTWYKNQILFYHLAPLLKTFKQKGIMTMILKGGALILLYYKDHGLRPMDDFDVLVEPDQASAAIDLMTKLQWRPKRRPLGAMANQYSAVMHDFGGFVNAVGCEVDLHQYLLSECCYLHADDQFWAASVPLTLNNVLTSALSDTDQLFHVCVHGLKWHAFPSLRWVADAMTIINAPQVRIDWGRLLIMAQERDLVLPIKDGFFYMQEKLEAPIPAAVLDSLRRLPIAPAERKAYRARLEQRPGQALWLYYQRYSKLDSRSGPFRKFIGFIGFLQYVWGIKWWWQVPYYLLSKAVRRLIQ